MTDIRAAALLIGVLASAGAEARSLSPDAAAYQQYRREVDRLTTATWRQHQLELDPEGRRGRARGFDLDHGVSARCAYGFGWPPERVAEIWNLRVIPAAQNRSEGARGCQGKPLSIDGLAS
jgi:hypothetical protein